MSHFAEIDKNNIVIRVLVGDNNDPNGDEGYSWFVNNLGGRWIQTSYNNNFRVKMAGIGDYYDEEKDLFTCVQPYPSWVLDTDGKWKPPTAMPVEEGKFFTWNEETLSWIEITE